MPRKKFDPDILDFARRIRSYCEDENTKYDEESIIGEFEMLLYIKTKGKNDDRARRKVFIELLETLLYITTTPSAR